MADLYIRGDDGTLHKLKTHEDSGALVIDMGASMSPPVGGLEVKPVAPATAFPVAEGGPALTALAALVSVISGGNFKVAEQGGALTALTALAGTIASGSLKAILQAGTALIGKVQEGLPTAFVTAQQTVGTAQVQLTAASTPVKTQPIVKADALNGGIVYVIVTGGTTSTGFALAAGEAVPVAVDDLNKIYLIASIAAQKVSALAGV